MSLQLAERAEPARVEQFAGSVLSDIGAAVSAQLVRYGHRLGLYRALAEHGPMSSNELAERVGAGERYVREWLANQAAGGYVVYEPDSSTFRMAPEQAAVLADPDSPTFMLGAFLELASLSRDEEKLERAWRTGRGLDWAQRDADCFQGIELFFAPTYRSLLIEGWIPALDGVKEKLESGALVADVGCGHGISTIEIAKAFPSSELVGFDFHRESIETARRRAVEAGVAERVRFEQATAKDFPGEGYDLIAFFDALHDMGDPVGAARHALGALDRDGTLMVVEPAAGDRLEDNIGPAGRAYYGFSSLVCLPTSLNQEVGLGLGAQAGETRLRQVLREAGYSRIRLAAQTPFNMILQARS